MAAAEGVSSDTVQRAYDKLVAGGHIYARLGSGFYVANPFTAETPPFSGSMPVDDLAAVQLIYSPHPMDRAPGSGVLRHETSAIEELNRLVRGVSSSGTRAATYGELAGYRPLREQLCRKFAMDGIDVPVDSILTVPGCIAGLSVVVRALVRPRQTVLMEDPGSFMHLNAILSQGAAVLCVPRLADGPDMKVLREQCERHRPTMFLLSSLIQNPTGSCISLHKARQLIDIAAEFDMTLVDDAVNADLLPPGNDRLVAPLILLDHLDRVIHVGGTSRILTPDMGVGYVIAGDRFIGMLRRFRATHLLGNMRFQERVLYRFLEEGLYRRRCDRVRAQLTQGATALRQRFSQMSIRAAPSVGGLHLWVDLGNGMDTLDIARRMLARGFLTAPGKHFRPPGIPSSEMRFNVTTTSAAALQAFAEVTDHAPA